MLNQIKITLTNFLNSLFLLPAKLVTVIDSLISLASTNPTKLITIVFLSVVVADLSFGRKIGTVDFIVNTIVQNQSIFTWPFAITLIAVALMFKK